MVQRMIGLTFVLVPVAPSSSTGEAVGRDKLDRRTDAEQVGVGCSPGIQDGALVCQDAVASCGVGGSSSVISCGMVRSIAS